MKCGLDVFQQWLALHYCVGSVVNFCGFVCPALILFHISLALSVKWHAKIPTRGRGVGVWHRVRREPAFLGVLVYLWPPFPLMKVIVLFKIKLLEYSLFKMP